MQRMFIGGTGRSGTSIVKRVVARHPAVASFPTELRAIVDPGGALDLMHKLTDGWSPYAGDLSLQRFRELMLRVGSTNLAKKTIVRLAQRLGVSVMPYGDFSVGQQVGLAFFRHRTDELLERLGCGRPRSVWAGTPAWRFPAQMFDTPYPPAVDVAGELAAYFDDLFRQAAEPRPVSHWVEDTPYNLLHLGDLLIMFPNLRFIHVHRDFRDVVASYRVQHWGGGSLEAVCDRIVSVVTRWFEVRAQIPSEIYWEVGLEDVVDDAERFYRQFLTFAGLDDAPEMQQSLASLESGRMHAGRWRRDLTASEQGLVNDRLASILASYRYA